MMAPTDARGGAISTAEVATPKAARYLQQLCKHFQHKRPVTFDRNAGEIDFSAGVCRLRAGTETLSLALAAPDIGRLAELQQVIERHLLRFAFRENLSVHWRDA